MDDHVMIDLETLCTKPSAGIVSIGAYVFAGPNKGAEFYVVVDVDSHADYNFTQCADTLDWWDDQPEEVQAVFDDPNKVCIGEALRKLSKFVDGLDRPKVWGNGAGFDLAILAYAYAQEHTDPPWFFWNERCYRTAKVLIPEPVERIGVAHNALDDAKTQGEHLAEYGQQFLR